MNMKKSLLLVLLAIGTIANAQKEHTISIESKKPSGIIDEMLYGQLFEHIYFSANNGVWQELIQERSFEPEQYPGIHPRDGYFDGWFMDDDMVLHSPTRYEQPLKIDSISTCDFDLTMDVNWRAYKLARRSWSGGLMDIRFAFRNKTDGTPYYVRIHDPYYESRTFTPAQTQSQIDAANEAAARAALQQQSATADFSICQMEVRESQGFGGRPGRRMNTLVPLVSAPATKEQVNEEQKWHKLRIESRGSKATVYWDGKEVASYDGLEKADRNFVTFWVNYTEATYRNIRLTAADGKVLFEGTPGDVKIPAVAQQWTAFGEGGKYRLVKDDAVNMRYSQEITAGKTEAGIFQGPLDIDGENLVGSIYAKGKGELIVGLRSTKGNIIARQSFKVSKEWKKYDFTLDPQMIEGLDGHCRICDESTEPSNSLKEVASDLGVETVKRITKFSCDCDFVIMVKGMKRFVREVILSVIGTFEQGRENSIRSFKVNGITVPHQLYPSDEKKRYFHIFYSDRKHTLEREKFEEKIDRMARQLKAWRGEQVRPAGEYKKYFDLIYYHEGKDDESFMGARELTDVINQEIRLCGYFAIITSEKMTAEEALTLYKSRDGSEKLFKGDKSFLGDRAERVYGNESVDTKIFVEFVALILRNRIYTCLKKEMQKNDRKRLLMRCTAL